MQAQLGKNNFVHIYTMGNEAIVQGLML